MPRIYVDFNAFQQAGNKFKDISTKVEEIKRNFSRTIRQLDWDVKCQNDIGNTAKKLTYTLDLYIKAIKQYERFTVESHRMYEKLDSYKYNNLFNEVPKIDFKGILDKYGNPISKLIDKIGFPGLMAIVKWKTASETWKQALQHDKLDTDWAKDLLQYTGDTFDALDTTLDLLGWYIGDKAKEKMIPGLGVGAAAMRTEQSILDITDGNVDSSEWQKFGDSLTDLGVEIEKLVDPVKIGVWSPGEISVAYLQAKVALFKYELANNPDTVVVDTLKNLIHGLPSILNPTNAIISEAVHNAMLEPEEKIVFNSVFLNKLLWDVPEKVIGEDYVAQLLSFYRQKTSEV